LSRLETPGIVQRFSIMRVEHVELDRQGSGAARPQHTKNVGVAGVGDGLGLGVGLFSKRGSSPCTEQS
jgi:hypothetical protein